MKLYRAKIVNYQVDFSEFEVIRETPCYYVVKSGKGEKRIQIKEGKMPFASQTKEHACRSALKYFEGLEFSFSQREKALLLKTILKKYIKENFEK